mmetsp:Transcript_4301/g.5891  ORF Transcript_4301/g.5891 Transcript_4301/m.5891 type:complete len:273 (-) Transcript_4301:412-1230(-)
MFSSMPVRCGCGLAAGTFRLGVGAGAGAGTGGAAGAAGVLGTDPPPAFNSICNLRAISSSAASCFASRSASAAARCVSATSSNPISSSFPAPAEEAFPFPFADNFTGSLLTRSFPGPELVGFFFSRFEELEDGFRRSSFVPPPAGLLPLLNPDKFPLVGGVTFSFVAPGMVDASFAFDCAVRLDAPSLRAAASFLLASSSCSFFIEMSKFSNSVLLPSTLSPFSVGAMPSPRFAASAWTSFASSDRYDCAAFDLYFFSVFPPYKSVKPCFLK